MTIRKVFIREKSNAIFVSALDLFCGNRCGNRLCPAKVSFLGLDALQIKTAGSICLAWPSCPEKRHAQCDVDKLWGKDSM